MPNIMCSQCKMSMVSDETIAKVLIYQYWVNMENMPGSQFSGYGEPHRAVYSRLYTCPTINCETEVLLEIEDEPFWVCDSDEYIPKVDYSVREDQSDYTGSVSSPYSHDVYMRRVKAKKGVLMWSAFTIRLGDKNYRREFKLEWVRLLRLLGELPYEINDSQLDIIEEYLIGIKEQISEGYVNPDVIEFPLWILKKGREQLGLGHPMVINRWEEYR